MVSNVFHPIGNIGRESINCHATTSCLGHGHTVEQGQKKALQCFLWVGDRTQAAQDRLTCTVTAVSTGMGDGGTVAQW